ncbi:MAG TPA: c-type cytochrome [Gemmatimonadaceae bacterium]|nr:c-type cytochrome [Gemmatimonadaceae bacterium]
MTDGTTTRAHALLRPATALLIGALLAGRAAQAQQPGPGGQQERPFENLKVFPKDIPRDSLLGIMRGFTNALGVNCQYCHVSEAAPAPPPGAPAGGGPRERLRPALDDKQTKLTARFMIRMADSLNRAVLPTLAVRHDPPIRITCATCHHGSPLPQTTEAMMAETIERAGIDSAIARYRQLRGEMISGRYDFREGPMNDLALSLAMRGRTADAIRLLEVNQEFFPNSADVDLTMAEVYLKAGDKDRATTRFRAALVKRPNDPRVMRRMRDLGITP